MMTDLDALLRHLSEEHASDARGGASIRAGVRHGSTRTWRDFLYAVAATEAPGNSRFVRGATRAA